MLIAPAKRQLVLVTGPPGAGKTTLAQALAAELGFALFAKDRIKEMLHDTLGEEADLAWSRRLGAAAMEMLWALAACAPRPVGLGPVVEADTTRPVDIEALAARVRALLPVLT